MSTLRAVADAYALRPEDVAEPPSSLSRALRQLGPGLVLAAIVLAGRGDHFSWARVLEGLRFRLPGAGIATAVAVFGITGVGAYSLWLVLRGA